MMASLKRCGLRGRRHKGGGPTQKPGLERLEDRCIPAAASALSSAATILSPKALQVVLVSDAVEQPQAVAAAALPGVTAVVYSAATMTPDALVALLEEIAATHGGAAIDHLALVTHGDTGRVELAPGMAWSLDNWSHAATELARLRSLLSPRAQLDLYVCNLADGANGQAFVSALAAWTGASVRASSNRVGSGTLGDFDWEFSVGASVFPHSDLLSSEALEDIAGLLLHDDTYEPNNSKSAVDSSTRPEGADGSPRLGTLTGPRTVSGLIMADTADWYQFRTVATGGQAHFVRIDLTFGDVDLHVYRADGTTRLGASESTGQNFEQVSLAGAPAGIYYARVFPKSTIPDSNYTLRIEAPPAAPATMLALAVDVTEVSEAAGPRSVLATVSRRGATATALDVTLTSSRPGDVASPPVVTIPAGAERVSVPLDLTDNTLVDGTRGVTLTATAAGLQPATATFNILDNEGLRGLFLSQAIYTGVEGSGGVRLTVVRGSLDTGTSVNVVYVTGDGTAKAGVDYTAASGTLTLAAGEMSKSVTIALADDGLAKANRAFAITLSDFGSTLPVLSPSRATVKISDNDLPPVADSERPTGVGTAADIFAHSRELYTNFVTKAYQTYLKRGPDAAGLNGWVEAMLVRRVTDETLEAGFLASPEYIQNNGGRGRGWIIGMYQDLLGRTPSESEVNAWLTVMSQGRTEFQVAIGFAASAEREGQRVRENYRVYLERSASQAEVDAYVAEFVSGRMTNEDVIARFVGSPEYYNSRQRGQGNRATWVAMVYEQVLFRHASRGEVEAWLRNLG
jgi:hypothetical protein